MAPPPHGTWVGGGEMGLPQRVEYACHACICMPMHAYVFICTTICTYACTSTYACIAYACRQMHAWHICIDACRIPSALAPHIPQRGGITMRGILPRWILWAPPRSTPHPTGGGGITITIPIPIGWGGGGALDPGTYIYIYLYIYDARLSEIERNGEILVG